MIKRLGIWGIVFVFFTLSSCTQSPSLPESHTESPYQSDAQSSQASEKESTQNFSSDNKLDKEETLLKITVGKHTFYADFESNRSAQEFREMLAEHPITVQMEDYGGFEKVGPLGTNLTRSDQQITTSPGDIILYQGNQIVIYYGTNSWNFTRLAKIRDTKDLKEKLGKGTATITFSLE